jgi:hypothetical protein
MQTHGKGKLVPTGKSEPTFDVSYGISHHVSDVNDLDELFVSQKKAIVHFIACDSGGPVPLGDFDLLVGDEILRLKHTGNDPEWLVLSANA